MAGNRGKMTTPCRNDNYVNINNGLVNIYEQRSTIKSFEFPKLSFWEIR